MQKRAKRLVTLGLVAVFVLAMWGCSQWGGLRLQPQGKGKATPEELARNWKEYNVYFTGIAVEKPSALIFDPKGDNKNLEVHPWWAKVEDQETILEVIKWMEFRRDFDPVVWRIIGPNGDFYGYMYTAWTHARVKVLGENTVWVDQLAMPPDYAPGANELSVGP